MMRSCRGQRESPARASTQTGNGLTAPRICRTGRADQPVSLRLRCIARRKGRSLPSNVDAVGYAEFRQYLLELSFRILGEGSINGDGKFNSYAQRFSRPELW